MYEELIKALRNVSEYDSGYAKLMYDAADTIEELTRENESLAKSVNEASEILRRRWIPVTERLPKAERKSYWVCTDTGYQCACRWTNNLFGMGESDEWSWSIFDIPQYQKVVAWMPLPDPYEPPKEET